MSLQEYAFSASRLLSLGMGDLADTRASSKAVDRRTVDDLDAWQRFDEFGERRTPHAVARRRGRDNR